MPNAISPASVDLSIALAATRQAAMERQRQLLRAEVESWADERESLASFIPAVFLTDTGQPAIPPAHLARIVEVLEEDGLGDTLIVSPPGSAKTNTLIAACAWWLGNDPAQHVGFFSNTDRQAYRRSVAVRDTITQSGKYRAIYPDVRPDRPKGWAEFEWFLKRADASDKDASFMAAGVGSAIQGSRLDRLLFDDIADERNMATQLQREKVLYWLTHEAMTRRAPRSRAVMICTRWHEEDPAAWAIKQGWRVIHLKALSEDNESYWPSRWPLSKLACPNDEHGHADPQWQPSEEQPRAPCWVERDEAGRITRQGNCWKLILGSRGFALTYQGEVAPEEGALFRRGWWQRYGVMPAKTGRGGIFIDTATDDKSTGDYFAMAAWRTFGADFYVENVLNRQLAFPDQVRAVLDARLASIRGPDDVGLPIYIEEVAWSLPLIKTLQSRIPGVIGVKPGGRSKVARAMAASPFVEARNVYLPEEANWVGDFIEQHAAFPGAAHDDMVDTTSLALFVLGTDVAAPVPPPSEVHYAPKDEPQRGLTANERIAQELARRRKPGRTEPTRRRGGL